MLDDDDLYSDNDGDYDSVNAFSIQPSEWVKYRWRKIKLKEEIEYEDWCKIETLDEFNELQLSKDLTSDGICYVFLEYAARHWTQHFKRAQEMLRPTLTSTVARITLCPQVHSYKVWRSI